MEPLAAKKLWKEAGQYALVAVYAGGVKGHAMIDKRPGKSDLEFLRNTHIRQGHFSTLLNDIYSYCFS